MDMKSIAVAYGRNSKEMFPSFDEETQNGRIGTTFYGDFVAAEKLGGIKALHDTWNRAWDAWKNDAKYCIELCLVMNHLCWEHENNMELCKWYADKYHFVDNRIWSDGSEDEPLPEGCENFSKEEKSFAFRVLD